MRQITVDSANYPSTWTTERREKVTAHFDQLAISWHQNHDNDERYESLDDAFDRAGAFTGLVVELGAGTGLGTRRLANRFGPVIVLDLSWEMIKQVPTAEGIPLVGDAAQLPFRDNSIDVLVLVNMLLFPSEVDRVLRQDGALVWVSTNAQQTPIYLSAEELVSILPGEWRGFSSRAGSGSWTVLRRH